VLGVVPPRGGLGFLDEPVGRYPTIHHHPKNKTTNPTTDGATDETPTTKNPPHWNRKGVIDNQYCG